MWSLQVPGPNPSKTRSHDRVPFTTPSRALDLGRRAVAQSCRHTTPYTNPLKGGDPCPKYSRSTLIRVVHESLYGPCTSCQLSIIGSSVVGFVFPQLISLRFVGKETEGSTSKPRGVRPYRRFGV